LAILGEHIVGTGSHAGVVVEQIVGSTKGAGSVAADRAVQPTGVANLVVADAPAADQHALVVLQGVARDAADAVGRRSAAGAVAGAVYAGFGGGVRVRFGGAVGVTRSRIKIEVSETGHTVSEILAVGTVSRANLADHTRNKSPDRTVRVADICIEILTGWTRSANRGRRAS